MDNQQGFNSPLNYQQQQEAVVVGHHQQGYPAVMGSYEQGFQLQQEALSMGNQQEGYVYQPPRPPPYARPGAAAKALSSWLLGRG